MSKRSSSILIVILLALFLPTLVFAQDYTCTQTATANGFRLDCKPAKTATPTRTPVATATPTKAPTATMTPTPLPTATPLPTNTPTAIATATPLPPTSTSTPTPIPAPVTPVTQAVLNVPLLAVPAGDPALNANHWALTWLGNVSSGDNYVSVRLVGNTDGLRLRLQAIDRSLTNSDAVTVTLNGIPLATWQIEPRGGNGLDDLRGWSASSGVIPWATFGGMPTVGASWPLLIQRTDADTGKATTQATWQGTVQWGAPPYATTRTATYVDVPLSGDAMLGGGTDCGDRYDYPEYFPGWGTRNWGSDPYATVENQWDVADWPCGNKWVAKWDLPAIPDGASVTGAELHAWMFGQMGYGCGYCEDGTKDTLWQAYQVPATWSEASIAWDTAPPWSENVSATIVRPVPDAPAWDGNPIEYAFDVGELVRRAYAAGDGAASVLFATAAGQYHSGKYFYSREGAIPPYVRIYYSLTTPTETPTDVPTAIPATPRPDPPTATPWPTETATPTPTRTPTTAPTETPTSEPQPSPTQVPSSGTIYYVSPNGLDSNPGAIVAPWATFNRAWKTLQPGDTLIVMDGVYKQTLQPNVRNGEPGKPITIKAMNDGKAIIDGQGVRNPVKIGDAWPGPIGEWFVIEGIVARNSNESVWFLRGDHNVLRRVSGYNANTDTNDHVFLVWANDNVIEDCLAAGTGRNMMLIYQGSRNTIRRCYTRWDDWRGADFCGVTWPNGNNIVIYNASDNRIENVIADGRSPGRGILIQANADTVQANNNQVLGSIAVLSGMDSQTSVRQWPQPRPANTCGGTYGDPRRADLRAGLAVWGQGLISGNEWRDVLATVNAGLGFSSAKPFGIGVTNGVIDHATIVGNGIDAIADDGGKGANVKASQLTPWTITNSRIGGTAYQGEGARLSSRYIDGVLTSDPLWPWPMDARAQAELGIDVTAIANAAIQGAQ